MSISSDLRGLASQSERHEEALKRLHFCTGVVLVLWERLELLASTESTAEMTTKQDTGDKIRRAMEQLCEAWAEADRGINGEAL